MEKPNLSKLIDNTPLALVAVGLLLIVVGAAGGWPNPPLQVSELGWRVALAVIGAFVVATGVLFYWRLSIRGNSTAQVLFSDNCNIKLVSPYAGERVGRSFSVSGTFEELPDGTAVWVSTVHRGGKTSEFWPQRCAIVDRKDKTWHSAVNHVGGAKGDSAEILVLLVGRDGQCLFDYFDKVGSQAKWPSIEKLTSDIVEVASVKVVLDV
ncbi:MAG: hypothetical protein WC712_11055 [Candidatus Brocadiia bacterium]